MADEVLNTLLSLNTDKAMGPDGIPAHILKISAPAIVDILAVLFNAILDNTAFPLIEKKPMFFHSTNMVIPVFSLTIDQFHFFLVLPKYLSPLSISRFSPTFNNLLTPAQSGFCPGHSTQDLLLTVTED